MKTSKPVSLINSDCLTALKEISSQSVDLILTDPPYNLGLFMQNRDTNLRKMRDNFFGAADWDNLDYESWKASLEIFFEQSARIIKTGGAMIVFMAIINYLDISLTPFGAGFSHVCYGFIPTLSLLNIYGGATIPYTEIVTRIGSQLTLLTKKRKCK